MVAAANIIGKINENADMISIGYNAAIFVMRVSCTISHTIFRGPDSLNTITLGIRLIVIGGISPRFQSICYISPNR